MIITPALGLMQKVHRWNHSPPLLCCTGRQCLGPAPHHQGPTTAPAESEPSEPSPSWAGNCIQVHRNWLRASLPPPLLPGFCADATWAGFETMDDG